MLLAPLILLLTRSLVKTRCTPPDMVKNCTCVTLVLKNSLKNLTFLICTKFRHANNILKNCLPEIPPN